MSILPLRNFFLISVLTLIGFGSLQAVDITLYDGTVLEDAEVKGETPETIYIQYGDQYKGFARSLVPDQYLEQNIEWKETAPAPSSSPSSTPFAASNGSGSSSNDPFGSSLGSPSAPNSQSLSTQDPSNPSTTEASSPFSTSTEAHAGSNESPETFTGFRDSIEQIFTAPSHALENPEIQSMIEDLKSNEKFKSYAIIAILVSAASFLVTSLIVALLYWPLTALFSVDERGYGKCFLIVFLAGLLGLAPYAIPFFTELGSSPIIALVAASFLIGPIIAALIYRDTPFRGFFSYLTLQLIFIGLSIASALVLPAVAPQITG